MNYKKIYNKGIAYELRKLGEKLDHIEPNFKKLMLDVYVFEISETFNESMKKAIENRKARRERFERRNDEVSRDE